MTVTDWLAAHPRTTAVLGLAMFAACVAVSGMEGA